jgi:hypothetical protein
MDPDGPAAETEPEFIFRDPPHGRFKNMAAFADDKFPVHRLNGNFPGRAFQEEIELRDAHG